MIGIYAPYDLTDTTAMAISLAEYASDLGYNIAYFCPFTKQANIHRVWDRKVKDLTDLTYLDWLANCDHVVWFMDPKITWRGARNSRVLVQALANKSFNHTDPVYDCIVVPSIALSEFLCDKWGTSCLHPVPWHLHQPFTNKAVPNKGIYDVYVPVTGLSAKYFARQLLCILGIVLSKHKNVRFTLATYRRFDWSTNAILQSLRNEFPGRISLTKIGPHDTRSDTYRQYDWTLYLPYKTMCTFQHCSH